MKQLLLLVLVFYTLISSAFGQKIIKGTFTDDRGQPLFSVVVRLNKMPDSTISKIANSNTSGSFVFQDVEPGAYNLQATLIGYQVVTKPGLMVNATDTVINIGAVILKPSSTALREVAINGQAPLIEKQIDKTVVNVDQNIANAGTNALELLKKLPGVQVSPDGQVTLNGKSGVNVIIDGKSTYLSAGDLTALLAGTPSSDIQKVEIMTNPSAKYDAEGTGGIINIIRKKNNKTGLNGNLTASYGQGFYNRYSGGLVLNYKTDNYNLYLNNSYSLNHGYNKSFVTTDILNGNSLLSEQVSTNAGISANRAYNTAAGLDLYLSKKTTLTFIGNASSRQTSQNVNSAMSFYDNGHNPTGSELFKAFSPDKPISYTAGMQLTQKPDTSGRQWSADVDYSQFRYKPGQFNTAFNYDPNGAFLSEDDVYINEMRTLRIFGARVDYTQPLPGNGKFEAGLKSSYVKTNNNSNYYNQVGGVDMINPSMSDDDANTENINAAYVNVNRQYGKWTMQAGLRAEQTVMNGQELLTNASFNQNYLKLFPTLFLNYKVNDQNAFNFQLSRRTDRPDYHELVPFRRPLSATLYFQGNPNLKPDLNWHTELTWAWQNALFITAAYDIDRNYLRTFAYLDSNKITMTRRPTNVQGDHSWNLDISYNKSLTKWFTTNTTVTLYQNSFNGNADGFSLNDKGFATVDLVSNNSFRASEKLSFEADFEYESKRQFVGSIFGAYSTLDLAIKQKLLHGQGSVTLNATDVFNGDTRTATETYLNLYSHGFSWFNSRVFMLTFSYRFGSGKLTKTQSNSGSEEERKRAGG